MKIRPAVFFLAFLALTPALFCPPELFAQGRHRWRGGGESGLCLPRGCFSVEDLDLTREQRTSTRQIDRHYREKIAATQKKLMIKRLELQEAFSDPGSDERLIRAKAKEVSDLSDEVRETMLDYQLAVRGQLTPEQLRNWCSAVRSCISGGRGWRNE